MAQDRRARRARGRSGGPARGRPRRPPRPSRGRRSRGRRRPRRSCARSARGGAAGTGPCPGRAAAAALAASGRASLTGARPVAAVGGWHGARRPSRAPYRHRAVALLTGTRAARRRAARGAAAPCSSAPLTLGVERVQPVQRERLGRGEAPPARPRRRRGAASRSARARAAARRSSAAGACAAITRRPSSTWPSSRPSSLRSISRAVGELARLAEVVDDRGAQQQVAVEARVQRAQLERQRRDGDGVLEQAAEVGVVRAGASRRAAARARGGSEHGRAAQLRAQRAVAEQRRRAAPAAPGRRPRARGARGSLRARRGRGRPPAGSGRVGVLALGARDRARARSAARSRKRSTRPRTRTSSPRSKRPASRSASRNARADDRAACCRAARASDTACPAREIRRSLRVHANTPSTVLAGAQRRDRLRVRVAEAVAGGGHRPMMYGGSDAAAHLGPPSRRPPGPGDGVRVPGLERRRRRGLERGLVPRRRARRAPLRARSTRRSSTTSRPTARASASTRASSARSRWPTVEIFEARAPRAPRDLVLVQGVEPSMRWRAFSAHIVDLAEALGVQVVVSLGALLGDVPHTRPVAMTGHASDAALLERLGDPAPRATRARRGSSACCTPPAPTPACPSASLWAAVPHYVAAATNPKAALALLRARGRADRRVGRRLRARVGGRRLRAPGRAGGAERPRHPGVRRTPRAGGRRATGRARRGRALGRRARARIPALPAPARARERRSRARSPRPRGRRSGSRRSSRPRARASARSAWARMPSPTSSTMSLDRLRVALVARDGHLDVVEHVVVGLARGLELPVLARRERVQRQLHVVARAARRVFGREVL